MINRKNSASSRNYATPNYFKALKNAEVIVNAEIISKQEAIIAEPVPPPAKTTIERADINHSKRLEQYEQVHALNQ